MYDECVYRMWISTRKVSQINSLLMLFLEILSRFSSTKSASLPKSTQKVRSSKVEILFLEKIKTETFNLIDIQKID